MSDFILLSGIATLLLIITTIVVRLKKYKVIIHRRIGYIALVIALSHGGLALYRYIKLNYFY